MPDHETLSGHVCPIFNMIFTVRAYRVKWTKLNSEPNGRVQLPRKYKRPHRWLHFHTYVFEMIDLMLYRSVCVSNHCHHFHGESGSFSGQCFYTRHLRKQLFQERSTDNTVFIVWTMINQCRHICLSWLRYY